MTDSGRQESLLPSLARVAIALEPVEPPSLPVRPRPWTIHAALHRLIERSSPTYAGRLHHALPKPLSLTIGDARESRVDVQLGLLDTETIDRVSAVLGTAIARNTGIELDHVPYRIAALRPHPVADLPHALTYRDLVDRSDPTPAVRLVFTNPATMRHGRESFRSIEPRHVFGGVRQRFAAFAGEGHGIDLDDATIEAITLAEGRMYDTRVQFPNFVANAFTGWALYTAPAEGPSGKTLAALANFACFAGVGARTAYGLGTVERRRP